MAMAAMVMAMKHAVSGHILISGISSGRAIQYSR